MDKRQIECASIEAPKIYGLNILSTKGIEQHPSNQPAYCDVEVYINHPGANDKVRIATWLPLTTWNGHYQGTGGGGFVAGDFDSALTPAVAGGYAAGSTDAGLTNGYSWANNTQLFKNFAYQSIHDMAVVGKAVAEQFYAKPVTKSYFNGCSTGGRQGYMAAQRYPLDFDGIWAGAPAINWDRLQFSFTWPYAVQNTEGFVDQCVFQTITAAAVAYCDLLDGGADSLISNPLICDFNATSLIGKPASKCDGTPAITAKQARIFNLIRNGPVSANGTSLWYGIEIGADYGSLAQSTPQSLGMDWVTNFVLKDPTWDYTQLKEENFPALLALSELEYHALIGSDDPNLAPFRDNGGKLLSWQGWADALVFPGGTIDYRERVQTLFGGPAAVNDFYRLFMAPGVSHCGGGTGAAPTDGFSALVDWVEKGKAPDTLPAANGPLTRNLCPYPQELRYSGTGDLESAASWGCTDQGK